ncbi:MAG: hypothetical protein ACKOA2_07225 [Ilumatobacteraceae bacterium]
MNRTRRIAAIATLTVLTVAGSVAAAARPDRPEPSRPAPSATVSDDDDMDDPDDDMDEPTSEDGMGPDTTGPAAFGLCTAWSHNAEQAKKAPPFRTLTEEFCTEVLTAGPNGKGAERAKGRPSSAGTGLDRADEASDGRRP